MMRHTERKTGQPNLSFVTGIYPLDGIGGVEAEFRDYAIGLHSLGVPVNVVDLFREEALKSLIGGFALAHMGQRSSRSRITDPVAKVALRIGEKASNLLKWICESDSKVGYHFGSVRKNLARSWNKIQGLAHRPQGYNAELCLKDKSVIEDILNREPEFNRERVYLVNAYDLTLVPICLWKRAAAPTIRATDRWVLRSVTEYTGVPAPVVASVPFVNEIWVPSDFQLRAFKEGGVPRDKIHKVPESLDTELFSRVRAQPFIVPNQRRFTFLTLSYYSLQAPDSQPQWNQAHWNQVRKALPLLLEAFCKAFEPGDDVCLLIKGCGEAKRQTELIARWMSKFGREEMCPQILYHPAVPSWVLPHLYASADAFVAVSRGEGWGRPLAEAMAMELPTIATGFGGNTEFMSEDNSYLVDFGLRPISEFLPGRDELGLWAEPSVDHLAEVLRRIFDNPAEAQLRGMRGAKTVRERFSRIAVAAQIRDRCKAICGQA